MPSLVSIDLLKYWQRMIPPPAQLCCCRIVGTDTQFLLRVRYKEAHLDYPLEVFKIGEVLNVEEIGHKLAALGQLVVSPEDKREWQMTDRAWKDVPEPVIMPPISSNKWRYDW